MLAEAEYKKKSRKKPSLESELQGPDIRNPQTLFSWMFSRFFGQTPVQ